MKTLWNTMLLGLIAGTALPAHSHSGAMPPAADVAGQTCSQAAGDLRAAMRVLWEEHVSYTRSVVISMLNDLPDRQLVTERLLRNQADIGNAIKPLYGAAAGDRLAALLKDHIVIAAAVVTAAKAGDAKGLTDAQKKWDRNATELADFLAGANPHWNRAVLQQMLQMHLELLTRQVVARLGQDWSADIKAYDEGEAHMMMFADVLTQGLVQQFPDKLGGEK